ncbi:MAG TPA: LuxR C-terminal-related transcriptional regulator [Kineosporiaceae bacterium]
MMARSAARPAGDLPVPVTRFIGRRAELAQVRRRLEESRLVTLTGVGGVGKTRLATEAAWAARRAFSGGVWMVDLSSVLDAGQVPQRVANALRVVDRSTRRPNDKIVDHLADHEVLLLLDNCEHVVDACAELVSDLLGRTRGLRVLATSRRTLGIPGEHLFAVPPLAVPDEVLIPSTDVVAGYDAVQLLVDRAAALQPGFTLSSENRVAAARLCARLDGLPLAIELAATRLRTLSLDQLVNRLEGRFALLSGGAAASGHRRQTLRDVMDWSHSLCSPQERLLWARLSVFAGGFDLDAAEGVCAGGDLDVDAVLDVLDRLVAQSIVLSERSGDGVRFRLLETIRQYGRERLVELGEEVAVRRRHRDHYLALARTAAAGWASSRQQAGLARLRAEHGNLRAALEVAVADPDGAAVALSLTSALRQHWYADSFLGEGRAWLDQALTLPPPGEPAAREATDRARVDALWVAAWVCLLQGDDALAEARLTECEALATRFDDERAAGYVRSLRGTARLFAGDTAGAVAWFEDAGAIFARIGDTEGLLWVLFQHAISLSHRGQAARAQAICLRSVAISESTGERLCRSYALWVLGFDTWRQGDLAGAWRWARSGLAIHQSFADPVGAALIIELLAWIAASRDDLAAAARLLGTAESVWALVGTTLVAFGPPLQQHRDTCEERVRAALDPGVAAAERARGHHPTVGRAIASILVPGPARPDRGRPASAGSWPDARPAAATTSRPSAGLPAAGPAPRASSTGVGEAAGATPGAPTSIEPLTSREWQVARLVGQGLSNRAIAAQLVISQRTVDGHVERILAKLGFSARTQVAAWVATREPTVAD